MMLIEDTPVPDAALPVEAFKAHLRMGSGFGTEAVQDAVLVSFLRAALAAIEGRTGKALMRRAFRWTLSEWRDPAGQVLPIAPIADVNAVVIVARDGTRSTVDTGRYRLEQDSQQPRVRPTGSALATVPNGGSVEITFDAGFAAQWTGLPSDLQQAVLMLAAHYYEYRNDTALSGGCMPFGVSSLIEQYKSIRLGARSAQ